MPEPMCIDLAQFVRILGCYNAGMGSLLYRCPATGQKVQTWVSDDGRQLDDNTFESVTCFACRRVHFINPKTGETLGGRDP
jgi:hypothetical protein